MTIKAFFLTVSLGLFIGCSSTPPPPPVPEAPKTFSHTVKYSGETFGALADWYLGDSKFWNEIQKVNPSIKPNKIKIGDVIQIPSAFAKKTAPYPKPKKKLVVAPKPEEKPETTVPTEKPSTSEATPAGVEAPATEGSSSQPQEEPLTQNPQDSSGSVNSTQGTENQTTEDQQREALREKTRQELLQEVLAGEVTPVPTQ